MALEHAQPLDVIRLDPLGEALAGTKSHSLLKTDKLQLIRVVLAAGEGMPSHHIEGEVTIQCIEGEVVVTSTGRSSTLRPQELLVLPAGEPHSVKAEQNASLLVTMLIHQLNR